MTTSSLYFLPGQPEHTLIRRFVAKVEVDPTSGCHLWTAFTDKDGYGRFNLRRNCQRMAHRMAYLYYVGSIPDGFEIDHRCHTDDPTCDGTDCPHRRCVNPHHLVPKSHEQNVLDGRSMTAQQAKQTHCHRGHPLFGDNLRYTSAGGRVCKQCRADWHEMNRNRTEPPRPRARTFTLDVLLDAAEGAVSQDPYEVLLDLHTKRVGDDDPRCRTCRDSKGRPTPWPCLTYAQLASALGVELDIESMLEVHNAGRALNGFPELKPNRVQRQRLAAHDVLKESWT